jgi:phospholipid/cholesterol/gamma-HCH transport system permease protein
MPLLTIVSTSAGIIGGFLVSLLYLDIPSGLFWGEVAKLNLINQFIVGFVKSVVFSWIIVWLGSFFGLRVHGGAEAVGRETTNSVVACIFAIIIADAIFSFIFYTF